MFVFFALGSFLFLQNRRAGGGGLGEKSLLGDPKSAPLVELGVGAGVGVVTYR